MSLLGEVGIHSFRLPLGLVSKWLTLPKQATIKSANPKLFLVCSFVDFDWRLNYNPFYFITWSVSLAFRLESLPVCRFLWFRKIIPESLLVLKGLQFVPENTGQLLKASVTFVLSWSAGGEVEVKWTECVDQSGSAFHRRNYIISLE